MIGKADSVRKIDLHIHTTVSDGTDTPEKLLQKVKAAGIGVFSVTDHDAIKAAFLIRPLLRDGDPTFIPGAEFSCKDEEGKYHILGYGFDPAEQAIQDLIELGHAIRMGKVTARIDALKSTFGFEFPKEEIDQLLSLDNPGKPHIANMIVRHGYAAGKEEAIRDCIDRLSIRDRHVRPEEAIRGILAAGGIPVLAHPFYGSGDELIVGEDMENRLKRLIGFGLRGLEAFYSGFSPTLTHEALRLAGKYDLLVTAGSDYHGKNKLIELADHGLCDEDAYPEGLRRFLEKVCR